MLLKNQMSNLGVAIAECGSSNQMKLLAEFSEKVSEVDLLLVNNREDMNKHSRPSNEVQDLRRLLEALEKSSLFRSIG